MNYISKFDRLNTYSYAVRVDTKVDMKNIHCQEQVSDITDVELPSEGALVAGSQHRRHTGCNHDDTSSCLCHRIPFSAGTRSAVLCFDMRHV